MELALFEAIVSGSVFAIVAVDFITSAYSFVRGDKQ
jgi:hypothetical protein